MATYYVGIGGNDGNTGLSWAQRFLTLNGAEDEPVAADDTVYIGPGVYREQLTIDVAGGAGTPISYIGDVTGEHTDGVGGIVRITGSDDDITTTRDYCVFSGFGGARHYRTFRGIFFDFANTDLFRFINSTDLIIEDCVFGDSPSDQIQFNGAALNRHTIRRCLFFGVYEQASITMTHGSTVDDQDIVIENCLFLGQSFYAVNDSRVGGVVVRNCSIYGNLFGVRVEVSPDVGQTLTVNNCIIETCVTALQSTGVAFLIEDFNALWDNGTDRVSVNIGGDSNSYPPIRTPPIFHGGVAGVSGFKFPLWLNELSEWSQIRAITGSNEPTADMFGIARPVTAAKNSWGSIQFQDRERETTTTHGGSDASIVFNDAGRHQIWVPVTAVEITISVYVYREADYAGNNPQMIIKQPGQADRTTTDAAAASQWNELTDTFTPSADPPYVVVELVSRNTNVADAATNDVFFDDLTVT